MGDLVVPAQASPTWGDLAGRNQPAVSLRANRAWFLATTFNQSTQGLELIGFWPSATLDEFPNFAYWTEAGFLVVNSNNNGGGRQIPYDVDTDYPIEIAWERDGYHAFAKRNGYWYRDFFWAKSDSSNYGGFSNYDSVGVLRDRFVLREKNASLLAPLAYVASPVIGSGSISGGEAGHSAYEYYLTFVVDTLPSSGAIRIITNFLDADNHLYLLIDSDGYITQGERFEGVDYDYNTSLDFLGDGNAVHIYIALDGICVIADTSGLTTLIENSDYYMSPSIRNATDWELGDLSTDGVISNLRFYQYCLRDETGLAANLVVNGGFGTNSDWTGTGWTIASGYVEHTTPAGTAALFANVDPLTQGTLYKCQMTAANIGAGSALLRLGDSAAAIYNGGAFADSNGAKVGYGVCHDSDDLSIEPASSFDGRIDNVIVQEVLFQNSELANILNSLLS